MVWTISTTKQMESQRQPANNPRIHRKPETKQHQLNFLKAATSMEDASTSDIRQKKQLVTSHSIQYSGDNCMISFQPYVDWMHTDRWNIQRSANFSANPDEAYRMESLDSLFLNPHSSRYNNILINRLGTTSTGRLNDYLNANVNAHATIRPKHMKGPIVISAGGQYSHSSSPQRTIYQQTFGPNNDPTSGSRPIHTDRYSSDGRHPPQQTAV